MDSSSRPLEIQHRPVTDFEPNPWNPNVMPADKYAKLKMEIRERGFAAPILAREVNGRLLVLDGEHRLRIARELGLETAPCVVIEADEFEARVKTVQMNGLRGENDPDRLAMLLAELDAIKGEHELEKLLPWSDHEIFAMIEMAAGKDDKEFIRDARDFEYEPPALEIFVAVLTPDQKRTVDEALRTAVETWECDSDGAALAAICADWLGQGERERG